ncbi:hypothetical protein FQN50_001781 [Emmonsiellopsis sp. PD_5]|nr:hypothetical protein FQN50_001781 [Emmonsiellopsis sp. PD_5]
MAQLSQDELAIITKYPLSDSLNRVRGLLHEAEQPLLTSYDGADDAITRQMAISKLLIALTDEKAAFNLRSPIRTGNLASELSRLFIRVQEDDFRHEHYRSLTQLILQKAPDVDIWKAVLDLITAVSRSTPPAGLPVTFDGTPVRSTSSSQKGLEQTRRLVEERLFDEIQGCTHRSVGGFFTKYFEGSNWSAQVDAMYHWWLNSRDKFPNPPTQKDVLTWWFRLQEMFLSDAPNVYTSTASKSDLTGSDAERQVDLLLKARCKDNIEGKHDWKDIRVVGELKQSVDEIRTKGTLLQIARYVREVFIAQPTRRFVHAFAVCGTKAEAWVFDRSGPFSSGPFDVYEDPKRFFSMLAGYAMMTDDELGLDTLIKQNEDGANTMTIERDGVGDRKTTVLLNLKPLCSPFAIVCRGTTCFLADVDKMQGVAKFSWTSDKRASEKELLKLAHERGVKGVAEVIGYRDITTIAELRAGLEFGQRHTFRSAPSSGKSSFSQFPSHNTRSRSSTWLRPSTGGRQTSRKRRSPNEGALLSKRSRPSSQQSSTGQGGDELAFEIQSASNPSLFEKDAQGLYDNRILRCLVISPAGRPIFEYSSPMELLRSLRDAIRAHQSLYMDGNILHRDISENNIIITNLKTANGHSGMLIDLDLAKEIGTRSGARHQTGTMEFMAIEVLLNIDHTYRHDLESFFYVLIWQCARHGWRMSREVHPKRSMLKAWYTGTFEDIARFKESDMGVRGFKRLLMEFPPELEGVKPLCKAIRDILFPFGKHGMFTGTPKDPETLYGPIITAYEDAISLLEGGPG